MFKLQNFFYINLLNFLFAFTLIVSLILRYPFDHIVPTFKIIPFISSFLVFVIAFFRLPKDKKILSIKYSLFFLTFFLVKFFLASTVANLKFQESIFGSFLELRFGLFFIFTPVLYFYFKLIDRNDFVKTLSYLICILLFFDLAALYFFADIINPLLRGIERFHISIAPLLIMVLIFIERYKISNNSNLIIFCIIIFFLHSIIISTSKTDALVCILALVYIFFRNEKINIFLNLNVVIFGATAVFSILFLLDLSRDNILTGTRDYLQLFDIMGNHLLMGLGSVRDATFNSFSTENYIWFSDFGIFLHPIRYGFIGWIIAAALVYITFISIFIAKNTLINQNITLFVLLLYIITIKPVIEYDSILSAMLFSFFLIRYEIYARSHK